MKIDPFFYQGEEPDLIGLETNNDIKLTIEGKEKYSLSISRKEEQAILKLLAKMRK